METMNGGEGGEDARQIAPGVARSDYRAGWAIVVIALVFLFCPGCGEGRAAESMSAFDVGSILLGVVGIAAGLYALMSRDDAKARRDELALANSKIAQMSREWRRERESAADRLNVELKHTAALSERIRALEAAARCDAAALDACAELLSGPNAPGEHTAARVALRATGRLGGEARP